jgi:hypothetical protein
LKWPPAPPAPPGYISVLTGYGAYDPQTGEVINPRFTLKEQVDAEMQQLEREYRRAQIANLQRQAAGGSGRTVFPWERQEAELRNRLLELQVENYDPRLPRDQFDLQAELGRGRLGLEREQFGQNVIWGNRDRDFRDAVQKWQEAVDARNFEAAQFWKQKAYELDQRAADRADKQLGLSAELGYAESRRADLRSNLERANALGYFVDDTAGVPAGTLTVSEQQRRFSNLLAQQDRAAALREAEQARKERESDRQFSRGVTIRQLNESAEERERARRERGLDRALAAAARSGVRIRTEY